MSAIAVFPDGRRIVTGCADGKVRVWDLRTGRVLAQPMDHGDYVLAVATTEDERVVSCSRARTVVWDAAQREVSSTGHDTHVAEAAIAPGGDIVATISSDETILQPGKSRPRQSGHGSVRRIAVSRHGQIVTAGEDPLVRVTQPSGAELARLDGELTADVAVAASADSAHIAFVTSGFVWYWNRELNSPAVRLATCDDAIAVAVAPAGGHVVAGGSDGRIWVWTPEHSHEPIRMPGRHASPVRSVAITPDGRQLVSGDDDGTLQVWALPAAVPLGATPGRQTGFQCDQPSTLDLLDFAGDVDGMAALITDRETEPPLAIALLGRWGSGKSSFMSQLHNRVAQLVERGRGDSARSVFATAVRQIRFDAWHFNDDLLWVGMVEHLFEGLAEPEPTDAERLGAERDAQEEKLRHLEELADPTTGVRQRLRARLRLWSRSLAATRGRVPLAGVFVLLLGTATALSWWLLGNAFVTGALAVLAFLQTYPIITWLVNGWRAVQDYASRRDSDLDRTLRETRVQLARLDAAQRLALVIDEARSGGYAQYRGLLGKVHADLRQLSDSAREAFTEWDAKGSKGPPPLERVILYIDDLDRCSPRKVVDVLAAVHLLLALPLFVVVVAVDPRWLRRCLEQYHSELFGGQSGEADGATPLDYLDKIFQVVFALRPMGDAEADRFVHSLVPAEVASPQRHGPSPGRPVRSSPDQTGPARPRVAGTQPRTRSEPLVPHASQLRLRPAELELVQRLRPLLQTPRSVKRFVNLYRLVRATESDDGGFIGADGKGPFQAVLVLLAVLVSAPECGTTLIKALTEPNHEGNIATLVEELASTALSSQARAVWARLLKVMRDGDPIHDNLPTYREWAGTIARFSFETWDLTEPR